MPLKVLKQLTDIGLTYNKEGLIPAIVQEFSTGEVLMLAYMNEESLKRTLESGMTCFYSRSRQELWSKGATSGHFQEVKSIYYDCDADTLLLKVRQHGVACHLGEKSCFSNLMVKDDPDSDSLQDKSSQGKLQDFPLVLEEIIAERRSRESFKNSYVASLFARGLDSILKKIGEEGAEVVIAAKNDSSEELIYEAGDLIFHLLLVLQAKGVSYRQVMAELVKRNQPKKGENQ